MKTQELNVNELKAINGGAILGGDGSSSNLMASLGIGNLLSFQQSSQDGDEMQALSFSLGNSINLDLGSMFQPNYPVISGK